jgi:hypothetical protein
MSAWTGLICLTKGQVVGSFECGNEPAGSIKCGYFLTSCEPCSFSKKTLLHEVELVLLKWPGVMSHSVFCITLPYVNLE